MLLAVDIGNTNIALGVFPVRGQRPVKGLAASWRMATRPQATADEMGVQILEFFRAARLDPAQVRAVAMASVVPALDSTFRQIAEQYFHASFLSVGPRTKTGVRVLYDHPEDVGADRIVNAVAAFNRTRSACIVVDFGTATTFDCVNHRGDYMGGAIAPGPLMAARALAENTAKLPQLGDFQPPASPIGKTTIESLRSGLFYGYVGLTEEVLQRLKTAMGGRPVVLATGGLAALLKPAIKSLKIVVPDLTLEGLRLVWERNL